MSGQERPSRRIAVMTYQSFGCVWRLWSSLGLKMLCVLDEHTRECLAIEVGKSLCNQDVILTLSRLMRRLQVKSVLPT